MTSQNLEVAFSDWKDFLQSSENAQDLILKSFKFENNGEDFFLIPFSMMDLGSIASVELLKRWRNDNQYAYPTRFEVTLEGTRNWLETGVLGREDRILFWVANSSLTRLGHLGMVIESESGEIEVDNVLRGESRISGMMFQAMLALERFIESEFSREAVSLRVLESNKPAVEFYKKLGYEVTKITPLKEVFSNGYTSLVEGTPAIDTFIKMTKNLLSQPEQQGRILTAGPSISTKELVYTNAAAKNGWNTNHSDFVRKFEDKFAEWVGVKHALATSSCTGALHLALLSLGVGPGDEVIVPDVTWVATASAVMYTGAKPVFAEIEEKSWTIDLKSVLSLISSKTKAIIPVHLYGYGAPMESLIEICQINGISIIEDAAPAIGTLISGKKAGTFGDFGCYSFQGAKLLVTGEGGMLVTNDTALYEKAKKIQDHGRKSGTFWIEQLGYKYKMNNLTAAFGLAQIERAENQILRKRRINSWYKEHLSNTEFLSFQTDLQNSESICWMTSISIQANAPVSRDELMQGLSRQGIDSRPVFPAISQYPIWGYSPKVNPIAKKIGDSSINLPSGVNLNYSTVNKISATIQNLIRK